MTIPGNSGSLDDLERKALFRARQDRLRVVMRQRGISALLTSDPINIDYVSGARNMTVFGMMGPARFLLLFAEGPVVLYEFAGCEHLAAGLPTIDEIRPAPGITAQAGPNFHTAIGVWTKEIAARCRDRLGKTPGLAVERLDFPVTDALRAAGLTLADAGPLLLEARRIKQAPEIAVMRAAVARVEQAVHALAAVIDDGAAEIGIWSEFHRALIAREGEYISTRLLQGGPRTFPYFQEAGRRPVRRGELLCLDTDAIGYLGYGVDFSRSFLCGPGRGSSSQRMLYGLAREQLEWNAALLAPGRAYEEIAQKAWPVPEAYRRFGYYCIAHGLGLSGEHPYIPHARPGEPYPLPGVLEPGMVMCVESYIGDAVSAQGVKLEDQFLITETGAERLTHFPFADALGD